MTPRNLAQGWSCHVQGCEGARLRVEIRAQVWTLDLRMFLDIQVEMLTKQLDTQDWDHGKSSGWKRKSDCLSIYLFLRPRLLKRSRASVYIEKMRNPDGQTFGSLSIQNCRDEKEEVTRKERCSFEVKGQPGAWGALKTLRRPFLNEEGVTS